MKKKIEKILWKAKTDPTHISHWDGCMPELMMLFDEAMKAERKRIVEEIEKKVIGENEKVIYKEPFGDGVPMLSEKMYERKRRNDFREEQRAKLKSLEEEKEKE